ncbi:hypothetical protein [Breznakiella homolactica]|uniref:Uncharacterized protein n=1 Tax=Breznakiella homolactica TaxID=2798577 RepID=A0A7T7XQD9_9SPIR|nr:hypothetical protein [Breznakiella homolactica]QQO10524.1 hypothetical protein JFL75_06310 [Breznakiella homolactica]
MLSVKLNTGKVKDLRYRSRVPALLPPKKPGSMGITESGGLPDCPAPRVTGMAMLLYCYPEKHTAAALVLSRYL